jgi:hypothetical protein
MENHHQDKISRKGSCSRGEGMGMQQIPAHADFGVGASYELVSHATIGANSGSGAIAGLGSMSAFGVGYGVGASYNIGVGIFGPPSNDSTYQHVSMRSITNMIDTLIKHGSNKNP